MFLIVIRINGAVSDGGLSLLKHPSAAMTRLLQSTTGGESGDQTLQRPVMSFVIKQHSLDGLQLAMKQALRKAACRVFALQVSLNKSLFFISGTPKFYLIGIHLVL